MNTLTMYAASVPLFTQTLTALSKILDKAQSHAQTKGIDPATLLNARLYPDMFTLTRQVQSVCDFSKGAVARLASVEVPRYQDNESTFEELRARIDKTLAFIASTAQEKIDGSEERDVALRFGGRDLKFKGQTYLLSFAVPSVTFHMSIAYAILRHNGVELDKADFLRGVEGF